MNPKEYFRDLSAELRSVKNRVRNLIGGAHWPSDGAWKESALRSVIRGYLPNSFEVGSGFIHSDSGLSTQIDIIIYDDSAPLHFRDGDFVVVPTDSVRAVIEVKTSLCGIEIEEAIVKLAEVSRLLVDSSIHRNPFIGLYCYDRTSTDSEVILRNLWDANWQMKNLPITALSFGESQFFRYWEREPYTNSDLPWFRWHAYNLVDMAPGYFIHNVIQHIFPDTVMRAVGNWFPSGGKEGDCVGQSERREEG